jgi:hypothetical protein
MDDFKYTLISRNCLDGFLHKEMNLGKYTNPFVWCSFEIKSFEYLIKNFNKIKFENIIFFDVKEDFLKYVNDLGDSINIDIERFIGETKNSISKEIYYGVIDNKILIRSIHMKYERMKKYSFNNECKNGIECLYNIYNRRLERMLKLKPLFIYNIFSTDVKLDTNNDVIYLSTNKDIQRNNVLLYEFDFKNNSRNWEHYLKNVLIKQIKKYIEENYEN